MSEAGGTSPGLLSLPAELRARIYDNVFADPDYEEEVDMLQIERYLAQPALTAVSRLIRKESLPAFEDAYSQFWANHVLCLVNFDTKDTYDSWQTKLEAKYSRLPQPRDLTHVRIRFIPSGRPDNGNDAKITCTYSRNGHEDLSVRVAMDDAAMERIIAEAGPYSGVNHGLFAFALSNMGLMFRIGYRKFSLPKYANGMENAPGLVLSACVRALGFNDGDDLEGATLD